MKIIIAGDRNFSDYETLKRVCSEACDKIEKARPYDGITIVSGTCRGADKLGEQFAHERKYGVVLFPADWNKFGRAAGPIRNRNMAEYADMLIAFWHGTKGGTSSMIGLAEKAGIFIKIHRYNV